MAYLTIIAKIVAKEDKVDLVKNELLKLVELTKKEKGCIGYVSHQDNNNPKYFLNYETWENEELLEVHKNNTALQEYFMATENAIEEFTVNKMTILA